MRPQSPIWRGAVVLVVGVVAAAALAMTPATGASFLTKKKALKLFYTKAQAEGKFLDQVEGDAAFLNNDEKAADADKVDGIDSLALAKKLDNVVTVSASGGDFTSVQAAVDSITDAGGGNPYVVAIGPGTYSGRVTLQDWVYLQGSGSATTLTASGASTCPDAFVVRGAVGTIVSDLTISGSGDGAACALGVLNPVGSSTTYSDVLIARFNAPTAIGMRNDDPGEVTIIDSEIVATGVGAGADAIGIDNLGTQTTEISGTEVRASAPDKAWALNHDVSANGTTTVDSSTLTASTGVETVGIRSFVSGGTTIQYSVISASTSTVGLTVGTATVRFSQMSGGPTIGSVVCAGVVDEGNTFSASTCPS